MSSAPHGTPSPLCHGATQAAWVLDAVSAAGAGQAERYLVGHPAVHCPLQGASGTSVQERSRSLHILDAARCGRDAAGNDLPAELLNNRKGRLGAQQLLTVKRDSSCHADLLSGFDLTTTQGRHGIARVRGSSEGPRGSPCPPSRVAAQHLASMSCVCVVPSVWYHLYGAIWSTRLPSASPPRRVRPAQEILLK